MILSLEKIMHRISNDVVPDSLCYKLHRALLYYFFIYVLSTFPIRNLENIKYDTMSYCIVSFHNLEKLD